MKKLLSLLICFLLLFTSLSYEVFASEVSTNDKIVLHKSIEELYNLKGKIFYISPTEYIVINNINAQQSNNLRSSEYSIAAWLFTMEATSSCIYDIDAPVDNSLWVMMQTGIYDASGKEYYASGTLSLTGIAYGFPTANKKQAQYSGTISCYIF